MDAAGLLAELKDKLLDRVPNAEGVGCVLCRHVLEDLVKHGTLTNKVPEACFDGKPHFPIEGKLRHLWLEGLWNDDLKKLFSGKT